MRDGLRVATALRNCDTIRSVTEYSTVHIKVQAWSTGSLFGRWQRPLLLVGLLFGFAVRLIGLGAWSFWYDETVSVYLARQDLPSLLAHTAGDIHPPGYYLLLHLWQLLAQPTLAHGLEFLFAWPSFWCGVLALPLLYALGRRLFGKSVGLVAVWLAVFNPFQLWYAQEVRMYTLGALLGLICLWATLQVVQRRQRSWLIVYIIAAAAGLYTLYFFAFLLIALNLIAAFWFWRNSRLDRSRQLNTIGVWVLSQVAVLVLWLPWLPVAVHQVTDPPVPPWRTPWPDLPALWASLVETFAALGAGQTPADGARNLWAAFGVCALAGAGIAFVVYQRRSRLHAVVPTGALVTILLYVGTPVALLYAITAVITPVYHVRYVYLYVMPFVLVIAWVVVVLWRYRWWAGAALYMLVAVVYLVGLVPYWSSQGYRTDAMRAAVARLAADWRPGDAILVNAGWIYPLLETYWPTEQIGATASLPPPLSPRQRLTQLPDELTLNQPTLVVTGNVDGEPSLGWGDPDADFYAMAATDTTAALDTLATRADRIWHFRLYDTVNDPGGVIRTWLAQHTQQQAETLIAGRDPATLQLYTLPGRPPAPASSTGLLTFGDALKLVATTTPTSTTAGDYLYTTLFWEPQTPLATLGADVSMSLRLYSTTGAMLAQADTAPLVPSHTWKPNMALPQPLALPVPADVPPGDYTLELIVYRQDNGTPLAVPASPQTVDGQRYRLANVTVEPAEQAPALAGGLATFDYVDLIAADVSPAPTTPGAMVQVAPGSALQIALTWRPRPNAYTDTYQALFSLQDRKGATIQAWSEVLGGAAYPSADWVAGLPVRDLHTLPLDAATPAGNYELTLQVQRASDALVIPADTGWRQQSDSLTLGRVRVAK